MDLIVSILDKMTGINKPQKKFMMHLLTTILLIPGKVNFRNLSRYSRYCEKSYSRHFARSFSFSQFNQAIIAENTVAAHHQVAIMDCSFVAKSGKKSYGLDYFHNGVVGSAQKGQEISLLAVGDVQQRSAFSLSVKQTPASKDLKTMAFEHLSGSDTPTRIDFYIDHLCKARHLLDSNIRHLAVDGYYAKSKFIDAACEAGLDVISKLRCDANLRYLYHGQQKPRGRRRDYAGKVDFQDTRRLEYICELSPGIHLYTAVVNAVKLRRNVRIALLVNTKSNRKGSHCILFSTDTQLSALQILNRYKLRFQIEFVFRDAKQFTGLTDCQATQEKKLDYHFNAALTALNVARLDHVQRRPEQPFSMTSIKRQYFNEHLMKIIFSNLEIDLRSKKYLNTFQKLKSYGAIAA